VALNYKEGAEKAQEFADAAHELMRQHDVPANPMNFTVWYNYVSDGYPELKRGLEVLISNKVPFNNLRNEEIFAKYFGSDVEREAVSETSSRIESVAGLILEHLGEAGRNNSDYGEKLAEFSGGLEAGSGKQDLRALVADILAETNQVLEKNRDLERNLGDSAREINDLRENLEELRQEAITDSLTGLANRKFFDAKLREAVAVHMESGAALSLLMLDIDHFKAFNDSFGHQVGDEVLKVVARVLKDGVKGRDTPARYGGEEFTVVLPETCLEDAITVAEHLSAKLASRQLKNKRTGESHGILTISGGVAQYHLGEPINDFLHRADEALYQAKRDGRNRVAADFEQETALGMIG
jgi:diguanylate cyclase